MPIFLSIVLSITLSIPAHASISDWVLRCVTRKRAPLSDERLSTLVTQVFKVGESDKRITILIDIPMTEEKTKTWEERNAFAQQWAKALKKQFPDKEIRLAAYARTGANNGDLPETVKLCSLDGKIPADTNELDGLDSISLRELLGASQVVISPTKFSTTAPLKILAKEFGFRGVTMPSFTLPMVKALNVDFNEVARKCETVRGHLATSQGAEVVFEVDGKIHRLLVDLRFREAHASSGLNPKPGMVGNLPSGETYIVPYEGEKPGIPSLTQGVVPVQFGEEVVLYRIEANRAVEVMTNGPVSQMERQRLLDNPAYGNIAELGFGVLQTMGVAPLAGGADENILLNEKIGFHLAFGRSDHLGGIVTPAMFSTPDKVVHIDRVYLPTMQPKIKIRRITLHRTEDVDFELMRDGNYTNGLFR